MSSILKALKKLEQESASNAGAPWPANAESVRHHRNKKIRVPGLIVLSVCILIGGGIGLFARRTIVPEPPAVSSTDEQSGKPAETQKQNASRHELSENRLPEPEFSKMASPEQEAITASAPEFKFATPRAVLGDNQPETKPGDSENRLAAQPDISVSKPSQGPDDRPAARRPVAQKSQAPVEVLEDPAIELQAISWSADAEKRLAIINGKICREKERVAGYVIETINSEDVIVSKGSVSGKLVFKIR